jgi:hypothetical protein
VGELMHPSQAPQNHMRAKGYVSCERHAVCDNVSISNFTIMAEVGIRHEKIIATYLGDHPAACGSRLQSYVLPDRIVVTEH